MFEQHIERIKKRNEFFYDEDIALCIRSLEAWQKVREEIRKEHECADVFLKYGEYQLGVNYGLGLALGVIDNALGEVGEQDG